MRSILDEEIEAATIDNEADALVHATHKDIQVLINIYAPCIDRGAENKVSDDTIETLSMSKVDAEGEVFGDPAETPKLEDTTLPLPIHEPSTQREAENEVSEDSEDTLET